MKKKKTKFIELPCFGIKLEIENEGECNGGNITSDLRKECDCEKYNKSIDGIESLILAHAIAGVDVSNPAYLEGIESAVECCLSDS